jgi:hypothetical protein
MNDQEFPHGIVRAKILAHLRRVVVGEILKSLSADDAGHAVSAAVQRLGEYRDEGPVQSIDRLASDEQFRVLVDEVIDELRAVLPASNSSMT